MTYQYRAVRTYDGGDSRIDDLNRLFNEGYEFVRASEFVPEVTHNGTRRYGYIEYIVRKAESEE